MPKLTDLDRDSLWTGDSLRLQKNYNLGAESTQVDLLVIDPNDSDCGLEILVVSGDKTGLIYAPLPQEFQKDGTRCMDMGWMKTRLMAWDGRETVECA